MDHYPSDEEIADRITALLSDGKPRTDAQIAAAVGLGADGADVVQDILDTELVPLAATLADGREVLLPALLQHRILTHRLTEEEVAERFLEMSFDLAALDPLGDLIGRTTSGVTFTAEDGGWRFTGPLWKHLGAKAGDLVSVRLAGEEIAIDLVEQTDIVEGGTTAELIAAAVTAADGPLDLAGAVWDLCAHDPDALTTAGLPLGELVDAAGLSRAGTFVGPAGLDITAFILAEQLQRLTTEYDLAPAEAGTVHELAGLYRGGVLEGIDHIGPPSPEVLAPLAEPAVASALVEETLDAGWSHPEVLDRLSSMWVEAAPRAARSNAWWIRAHALTRAGATLAAEEALEKAIDLDGDNRLALVDLARFAADRGNAARTLSLLQRADVGEDHPTVLLLRSLEEAPTEIGRNDPCWCGSGRKFKNCHLHGGEMPLDARALWLYERAAAFLPESRWWSRAHDLAELSCDSEDPDHLAEHENDDLVVDALLAEDGAFAGYLEQRGMLLSAEDRALAETWSGVPRGVYVVVGVSDDMFACVPHRDLPREPDPLVVVWPGAGEDLTIDDVVCTRLLPVGDTLRCLGGVARVEADEVAALHAVLDRPHTAEEIVELLAWDD